MSTVQQKTDVATEQIAFHHAEWCCENPISFNQQQAVNADDSDMISRTVRTGNAI
jgi:hypothetical protein